MFTVHIDDSGTDPNQRVAIATAMIVPAVRIVALDKEWETLKEKEEFPDFHMSACVNRNKKTCFADWDEGKIKRVVGRVRQIGMKYGIQVMSLAVKKDDYDELVTDSMKEIAGKYHYSFAISNMIDLLDKWAKAHNVVHPFEYIYDWMDPKAQRESKSEIDLIMAHNEDKAKQRGNAGRYVNYSFRRREDIPALQCTDPIAWTCYQYALWVMTKLPLSPMAEECWNDYYNRDSANKWLYAAAMTRQQVADWVSRENEFIGEDLKYYRKWITDNPQHAPKRKKRKKRRG